MTNDEPCMCGTPFACMADDHDAAVAVGIARAEALTAERARFALIATRADQLAEDARRDPGMYPNVGVGFEWAADHIRAAISEAT